MYDTYSSKQVLLRPDSVLHRMQLVLICLFLMAYFYLGCYTRGIIKTSSEEQTSFPVFCYDIFVSLIPDRVADEPNAPLKLCCVGQYGSGSLKACL